MDVTARGQADDLEDFVDVYKFLAEASLRTLRFTVEKLTIEVKRVALAICDMATGTETSGDLFLLATVCSADTLGRR